MDKKFAITIARQYGSGGREIGKMLAKRLEVDFYDKELLSLAAKKYGLSEKMFEQVDEKPTNSLLYSLAMGAYAMDGHYVYWGDVAPSLNDKVYQLQADTIKDLASEKSCIFVGRCADYILSEHPCLIKIFISSDKEKRIERIKEREKDVPPNKIEDLLMKTDKRRANYYSYHTNKSWDKVDNYDLCINSAAIPPEKAVELIVKYVEMKTGMSFLNK